MSRDLPSIRGLTISEDKVTCYCLNIDHPRGGPKARFLFRFGFEAGEPRVLQDSLADHLLLAPDAWTISTAQGDTKIVCEGPITSPDGRHPMIRTVWMLEDGFAAFVTLIPLSRGKPSPIT
ncbi:MULTISPECIES: DUF6883 domain-containing protein [unclassified Methylobacterium]|uniref:DUF6883 domain-containing protein n=1 Tax=unclassified Methylobacterium TaxID=2615210 RepID=UPI000702255A|nr:MULTISPECIES: DUF6883 domain-containing protein [unclassified Methylobacterium]KQO49284.1 hypothetical protein ASF24_08980 [Methylobacterium sp. Leaf86]KQP00491.1 hypothetical protein ASF32_00975 [Methylobacterium sp. Leaf91]